MTSIQRDETNAVCDYIRHGGDREAFLARFRDAVSTGFDPDAEAPAPDHPSRITLRIRGLIGAPGVSRSTREDQHLFVNRETGMPYTPVMKVWTRLRTEGGISVYRTSAGIPVLIRRRAGATAHVGWLPPRHAAVVIAAPSAQVVRCAGRKAPSPTPAWLSCPDTELKAAWCVHHGNRRLHASTSEHRQKH